MDLDALLDDAADEHLEDALDLDETLRQKGKFNDIKPWLAYSCHVPPIKRDAWSKMVKVDALLEAPPRTRPSNNYFSWEKANNIPVYGGDKLLQEVLEYVITLDSLHKTRTQQRESENKLRRGLKIIESCL